MEQVLILSLLSLKLLGLHSVLRIIKLKCLFTFNFHWSMKELYGQFYTFFLSFWG